MITSASQYDTGNVLVVDDEIVVREVLSRMLRTKGCSVEQATNGADGLAKVEEKPYDVVITDIKMPKMDGFEFMENLRTLDPEIPVIIVTAVGDVKNAVKAVQLGAYDFVHKPFGAGAELWTTVERAIELRRTRLENETYHRQLEEINTRLTRELQLARRVQECYAAGSLIPDQRLDLAGLYEPCFNVGGDLYGAFPIGKTKYAFYMADVSGHGPSAALITAMVKMNIESLADRSDSQDLIADPPRLLTELDRMLFKLVETGMFVTMIYAVLDMEQNELAYCNAGHCFPLVLRAGEPGTVSLDNGRGIALTLAKDLGLDYQGDCIRFGPGDTLLLCTDGLLEAHDPDARQYGSQQLSEVAGASQAPTAEALVEDIRASLREFAQGVQPHDDVAVLVARRKD
ncbi:MAG: SpoIIE family protein phosphatase [Planctomycetes bacterium]|nr:SpoIIE family protein phosphatase [Planctomycetota bacterium]